MFRPSTAQDRGTRPATLTALLALLAALLVTFADPAPPARAAVDPDPRALPTVTARPLPTWQTNGVVYAVETVGNVVYAGGNFTAVRPAGAAAGQQEVPRKNIAAFNATTGALLPFSHSFRDRDYPIPSGGSYDKTCSPGTQPNTYTCDTVYEIRASRDGSRIYVGGDFTQVDGQARGNLAAFSTSNDALLGWRVTGITGRVRALTVTSDTVFFGGSFTQAGGQERSRLAAADAATGAVLPWAPTADKLVITMAMATDDSRVILGGQFDTINGAAIHGLAAVSSTGAGESTQWDSRPIPATSYVTDLSVAGDVVYASANGEGGGVFDGRLAAQTHTGQLLWRDTCLGATWAIEVAGDLVYSGSHAHDCSSTAGGFPESWNVQPPAVPRYYRLLAQTRSGEHAPYIQHWFPTTNGGIVGKLGPRDLTWTGSQLWVAGEFTTVNGAPQQGLTRFGTPPTAASIAPQRPEAPTLSSPRPGEVRVSFPATEDLDDPILTYTVLRGASTGAMAPIGTVEAASKPWSKPTLRFRDTTAVSGQSYVYQIQATDPSGVTSPRGYPTSITVSTSAVDAYADEVLDSDPALYWRLDDAVGSTTVRPLVGNGGVAGSGTTFGVTGAVADVAPGNTAVRTSGTSTGAIGSDRAESGPNRFSAEVWFRTTTTRGGKLLGFGNSQTGNSSAYDRHVYMRSDGRLVFGVYPGGVQTITSPNGYRDGRWHHLVASLGDSGMRLFVDGSLVAARADVTTAQAYNGYWRLGSDNLGGWPGVTSSSFEGELDEFAVYDRELSGDEVVAHRLAGVVDTSGPTAPTITSGGAGGTTVALAWSEATDDVMVAGYEVHRLAAVGDQPTAQTRVATTTASSVSVPGVEPGTAHWTVVAIDTAGNRSEPAAPREVTVVGERPYAQAVLAGAPSLYWRLDDPAGTTAVSALVGPGGGTDTGATLGVQGVFPPDTALATDGTTRGVVASTLETAGPQVFTAETWFRTSTTRGGKILGFGRSRFGTSTNYDRHVYMRDDGTLVFGVYPGYAATVSSSRSYNDGAWHHLAASLGPAGMRLMVDGDVVAENPAVTSAQDYSGYWRLGGDTTWGGASSSFLAGSIDEFAVYPRQLAASEVREHVAVSGVDNAAPTAPDAPQVTMTGDDAVIAWAPAQDNIAVTSYEVHRSDQAAAAPSPATLVTVVPGNDATEADVPAGTWFYRVVAVDAAGNHSQPSPAVEAISAGPDVVPPGEVTGVATDVDGDRVRVSWAPAVDDVAVAGYEVHRGEASDFAPTAATLVGTSTTTTYDDTDVPPGTWFYRVVAVDTAENRGEPSAAASADVAAPDTAPPPAPGGVTATVTGRSVSVDWGAVADPSGIGDYRVYRLAAADGAATPDRLVATTTSPGAVESDVPAGTWYYRVVAVDGAGNAGPPSAAAVATVSGDPVVQQLSPVADAWVDSALPDRNYGNAWALTADAQPEQQGHVKFQLPATPTGRRLVGAILRLSTTTQTWSGSPAPAWVRAAADAGWTESGLTWSNRPALAGPELGALPADSASDTTYDVVLDPVALAAHLGSQVDLVVGTDSSNGIQLVSDEGATARRPRLLLAFE